MPFGLWARRDRINHLLDRGSAVLRDVAMSTNFGTQFAITGFRYKPNAPGLFVGYNFGCMIASDTLFDCRGGFSGSSYPMKA